MKAEKEETRRLAAIMFTDMVGFSRLMHENEEKTLRLLDEHDRVISETASHHRGHVLKRMGDASFLDFSSATDAVTCAIRIQTRLRDYNAEKAPADQIVVRIGIHVGDVIMRDGDLFGDGINVAARLQPLSEPGGICLSQAVYQEIRAHSDVQPILVGEVELKNILEKHVIYRIPPFYGSQMEDRPRSADRHSLSFGVQRIERLPPPKRSPLFMSLVGALLGGLSVLAGMLGGHYSVAYLIWETEVVDPAGILTALQQRRNDALGRVWESLDKNTRHRIEAFDPKRSDEAALAETLSALRQDLNKLIAAKRPIFDNAVIAQLRPAEDGRAIVGTQSTGKNLKRVNRFLLEAVFPGQIQPYLREPSVLEEFSLIMPYIYWPLLATAVFEALFIAFFGSLLTYRISFKDVRDVDSLLEYFIRDLGFRAPRKMGDALVFQPTWWNILVYYGFSRLEAIVSGNRVVVTGPTPLMLRLRKRILSFAENQP
jgi:class 3 adenylate cyclase